MTGLLLFERFKLHGEFRTGLQSIQHLGVLALYFYIVYRIGSHLETPVLKWAWLFASCFNLPILNLAFEHAQSLTGSLLLLASLHHALAYIKKEKGPHFQVLWMCSITACYFQHTLIFGAATLLFWIAYLEHQSSKSKQGLMMALSAVLLCLICLFVFPYKTNSIASNIQGWREYAATLALFITSGNAAWFRFYLYFLAIIGFGLFFFCAKNTAYAKYLSTSNLLPVFILLGQVLGMSFMHVLSDSSYPATQDSIQLFMLFATSILCLAQEVASFAGRQRTVFIGRLFVAFSLLIIFSLIDLFTK